MKLIAFTTMILFNSINKIESFKVNNIINRSIKQIAYLSKKNINDGKIEYTPKSINQNEYKDSLSNKDIDLLFCLGPAGTGKTLFACQYAIKALQYNMVKKIIITRPMIAIEEDMGFLPGNIKEKMHPWTIPIFDIFEEIYSKKEIDSLIDNNIIEIAPLGFMQGRTFKNSIIIADEMQNSTPQQMFMLLTRIGIDSKMIITGDLMQTKNVDNGLNDFIKKYKKRYIKYTNSNININIEENNGIKFIELMKDDIQRSEIVVKINEIYK